MHTDKEACSSKLEDLTQLCVYLGTLKGFLRNYQRNGKGIVHCKQVSFDEKKFVKLGTTKPSTVLDRTVNGRQEHWTADGLSSITLPKTDHTIPVIEGTDKSVEQNHDKETNEAATLTVSHGMKLNLKWRGET